LIQKIPEFIVQLVRKEGRRVLKIAVVAEGGEVYGMHNCRQ
jgi:hypothetical protein